MDRSAERAGGPASIDWTALPASTPAPVRRLLERCLDRDPRRRLRDIGEARIVLDDVATGAGAAAPSVAPPRTTRRWAGWPVAVLGVAIIAAAAVLATIPFESRSPAVRPATRFPLTLPPGQPLVAPTPHHVIALSPDGRRLVYVGSDRLYLRALGALDAVAIAGTDRPGGIITEPAFSPDGRSIAFWSGGDRTIKTIPVEGGLPTTVAAADNPFGLSWADDAIYMGAGRGGIVRVRIGGSPAVVARVAGDEWAHGPQRLPGGGLIFTIARGSGIDRWDTARVVVQLPDGSRRTLIERATDARYVATGHLVYGTSEGVRAVAFDARRLAVSGSPLVTLAGVRGSSGRETGAWQFAVADSGTIAYVPGAIRRSGPAGELGADTRVVVDRSGVLTPLPLPPGAYREVRAARDGRLAIAIDDGADAAIYLYDPVHPGPLQRLTSGGRERAPLWSADGRSVAFQSDRDGDAAIFWQPADGSRPPERLTTPGRGESHWPEAWLPDGRGFLFSVRGRDDYTLWLCTLPDRRTAPFGDVRSTMPIDAVVSPDGHWLAYGAASGVHMSSRSLVVQPIPATGARYTLVQDWPKDAPTNAAHKPLWADDSGRSTWCRGSDSSNAFRCPPSRPSPSASRSPSHADSSQPCPTCAGRTTSPQTAPSSASS